MVKNGCCQSDQGTLKLTLFQEGTDGIDCSFACWYKFRKAESCFNDFWVDIVKKMHDLLVLVT